LTLLLLVILRQPFELLEKDQSAMRRNLEALAAHLAGNVVVNRDEVVLDLGEERASAPGGICAFLVRRIQRIA